MLKATIVLDTAKKVSDFVKVASKLDCDIDLVRGSYVVDAKSIMGIFSLSLDKPIDLIVRSEDFNNLKAFEEWFVEE